MLVNFSKKSQARSWTGILIEESENSLLRRKAKRNRTFRRMYMSVFVTFSAGFVVYCSLFYVGAFLDVGKVVGISQSVRADNMQKSIKNTRQAKERTLFSPLLDSLSTNRIYMRRGQTIQATYALPSQSKLTLKIKQCKSRPILEVFNCEILGTQGIDISNRTTGFMEFTVTASGFYYFEDQVVQFPDTDLKAFLDYRIIWQRGGKRARIARPLRNVR